MTGEQLRFVKLSGWVSASRRFERQHGRLAFDGQLETKGGAAARPIFSPDAASVHLDDPTANRQTQSDAMGRCLSTVEFLEHTHFVAGKPSPGHDRLLRRPRGSHPARRTAR